MSNDIKHIRAQKVSLSSLGLNEKWLQDQIEEDPSILGLGDLTVYKREKIQSSGGRIDFLMSNPDTESMYEIEIQLGKTDESHIIRTIEYWDLERKRFPTKEHRAVIVAEDITNRFFNVINLFNNSIPLIAILCCLLHWKSTHVMRSFDKCFGQNILMFSKLFAHTFNENLIVLSPGSSGETQTFQFFPIRWRFFH